MIQKAGIMNTVRHLTWALCLVLAAWFKSWNLRGLGFIDKRIIVFCHDVFWASAALPLALWLRTGGDFSPYSVVFIAKHTVVYGFLAASSFLICRLYRGVWRYVSLGELVRLIVAVTGYNLFYIPLMMMMSRTTVMPRSVVAISWIMSIFFLGGMRFGYRLYHDRTSYSRELGAGFKESQAQKPLLLIGAGDEAELFLRDIARENPHNYHVVGLIDENKSRRGRLIHGQEILGSLNDLGLIFETIHSAGQDLYGLVLTDSSFKGERLRGLLDQVGASPYPLLKITRLPERSSLKVGGYAEIQPVSLDDLLGRAEIQLDLAAVRRFLAGKRVLVTGGGGTIGGELCRQIGALGPQSIGILDHSEHLLYTIHQEMKGLFPALPVTAFYGDVANAGRVAAVFRDFNPDIIFHAAALKHVPIAEDHLLEALEINTLGAKNVADQANATGASAMIFISTDKAVHPTNIMGATKRLAEHYCQVLDGQQKTGGTRYITTRFGNVLGSNGSVVPLFHRQIKNGGPITVTDPDITRYFMSVKEAVELVLQAASLGYDTPEKRGGIYVLDMGRAVRIDDLARQMVHLSGLKIDTDIKIVYTGLRPGEKLYEELFYPHETLMPTACPGLLMAMPKSMDYDYLNRKLTSVQNAVRDRKTIPAFHLLQALVPDYTPFQDTVKRIEGDAL